MGEESYKYPENCLADNTKKEEYHHFVLGKLIAAHNVCSTDVDRAKVIQAIQKEHGYLNKIRDTRGYHEENSEEANAEAEERLELKKRGKESTDETWAANILKEQPLVQNIVISGSEEIETEVQK